MISQEPLKSILPRFLDDLKEKGRSPSTILAYRADLEQLLFFVQQKNKVLPEQVRPEDIESFRDSLMAQKYTAKSTSRKLNAIKTFFRWLKEQKILVEDPSKSVSHPKIQNSLPRYLSPLEYRALRDISRADARVAAIIEVILQTGIRISEIANLKLTSVNENELVVDAFATQPERRVSLNEAAKSAISRYVSERPKTDSEYVFVSKNGKPLAVRNIRAAVERFMQRAEIQEASVNDLRTTFIIENLKRGVDLVTISHAVGHKRISTTERYLELAGVKEPGRKTKLEEL